MATERQERPELSVLDLITELRAARVHGKSLHPADRRRCVEYLSGEGYTAPEIMTVIRGVGERTIHRDRQDIRQANALHPHEDFVAEMAGFAVNQAVTAIARIRRTTREKDVPPQVKVEGDHKCFLIAKDLVQLLQGVGYLPSAAQTIQADLTHHINRAPATEELRQELLRLEQATRLSSFDADSPAAAQLSAARASLERLVLLDHLESIPNGLADSGQGEGHPPEREDQDDSAPGS